MLHLKFKWKCVAGFPASCCVGPNRLSVCQTCYQAAEITAQASYSNANYELSLWTYIKTGCQFPSFAVRARLLLCLSGLFPFCLTPHFAPASLGAWSCLSSVPVRWNIGALLMIPRSFLYLSIHLFLPAKPLYRVVPCQGWFPLNSAAEELCSLTDSHPHLLHSLPVLL